MKNRPWSVLEHQKIIRDGKDWLDWPDQWLWKGKQKSPGANWVATAIRAQATGKGRVRVLTSVKRLWVQFLDLHALRPVASADF